MRIRGLRECQDCGREWSYYEIGEIDCPDCGSLRSVGIDERSRHTDSATELNLAEFRSTFEEVPIDEFAEDLKSALWEYRRERGFISGGDLLDLDDAYLAASELLHAIDVYARERDPSDDEQYYLLELLGGADRGERPAVDEVPKSMTAARGLGYAEAVREYRQEVATWLDDNPHPEARRALETLSDQVKRAEALQGDVAPERSETLVAAAREVARYLREGDETALSTARDRLDRL